MLVNESHKVVYGSKKAGVTKQEFTGTTWTLAKDTSMLEALSEIPLGVADGKLPKWPVFLNMIRQGLNIADRGRILAENGIAEAPKAGKRALEQAIMVEATQSDLEAWIECCRRGPVAITAYYDAMITGMQDLTPEPLTVTAVPDLFAQILNDA